MKVLAIESSCDETSAAVVEKIDNKIIVHSNVTATSLATHAKTGGIIPENAAREQVKYIIPVITHALIRSRHPERSEGSQDSSALPQNDNSEDWNNAREILKNDIDAIAVTYGPGLIGSLLVGVETVKTLSFALNKPIIPVNHLLAHLYANYIRDNLKLKIKNLKFASRDIQFPYIGLIVSGGHTDLLLFKSHGSYKWLGGTRDDAAGEALDKIGRLLGLEYPAGAEIEKRAKLGDTTKLRFHAPLIGEDTFDFSFSGLKTEAARYLSMNHEPLTINQINEVCFAVQKTVIDVLVKKTLKAAETYNCPTILLGGGVAANQTLRENLELKAKSSNLEANIFSPEKTYCTDNGAMIGAYALMNPVEASWKKVNANPELYFA